jgi:phosphomannomutase
MVTASHNPPKFNGIKLFTESSLGYSQAQEAEIEKIFFEKQFRQGKKGTLERGQDMKQRYLSFIKGKLSLTGFEKQPGVGDGCDDGGRFRDGKLALPGFNHRLKVVLDPGNGAAARFASDIFVQMGLDVIPVNDEPDGLFPGRSPEPKEDTLRGTVDFLRQHNADLAICFDGDADRVVFCDEEGFLGFNEPIAFISRLAVKKTGKKKVATTVETGTLLDLAVKDLGAEVVRGKVGDAAVAHLARQLDAALGVEQVGVYIMPEVGYYPDSIFASLFLLSQLSDAGEIRQFFQAIPRLFFEKAKVSCPNELKESTMARVKEKAHVFAPDEINTVDGLRLKFADSWMLIRASGTEPVIRVISESTSQKQTDELIGKGKKLVQSLVEADR